MHRILLVLLVFCLIPAAEIIPQKGRIALLGDSSTLPAALSPISRIISGSTIRVRQVE